MEAEKKAIDALMTEYVRAISGNGDISAYSKVVVHDKGMTNYGTDGQPIIGWEALEKTMREQFAGFSDVKVEVRARTIHVEEGPKFAWATDQWTITGVAGGKKMTIPGVRCTWIFARRDNRWVIIHFHKSVPAPT